MTHTKNRVFIGGISATTSKESIEETFGKYGRLESVWVAQNPPGFAFVQYEHYDDASKAVKDLNGTCPFDDAKIRVEHSRDRNTRGGGRGGSYGGGGRSFGRRGGGGYRGDDNFSRGSRGGSGGYRGGSSRSSYGDRGDRYSSSGGGSGYHSGGSSGGGGYRSRSPLSGGGGRKY